LARKAGALQGRFDRYTGNGTQLITASTSAFTFGVFFYASTFRYTSIAISFVITTAYWLVLLRAYAVGVRLAFAIIGSFGRFAGQ
jgi:hypothetical protein